MIFWRHGVVGGRGGGPSLLRRGENRLRQGHGEGGGLAGFWPYPVVAGRGGGPSLLRRGEKRLRQCHPLAGFKRLRATAGQGPN